MSGKVCRESGTVNTDAQGTSLTGEEIVRCRRKSSSHREEIGLRKAKRGGESNENRLPDRRTGQTGSIADGVVGIGGLVDGGVRGRELVENLRHLTGGIVG